MKKFNIFPQQNTPDLCISRDEEGKPRIYTTLDGDQFPSITSVLSATMQKYKANILRDWQDRIGIEEAEKVKIAAADRGSKLHHIMEKHLFGEDYSKDIDQYTSKVKRLIKQILPILDKSVDNIRLLEKPLYSKKLKVAGRVDMIAEFNQKLSVVDFKTSTGIKTINDIDDYLIQETFYGVCYQEHFGEKIEQIVTIIATENSLKPYVFVENPRQYLSKLVQRVKQYGAI